MTLSGAVAQLVELENNSMMPEYFKPSIKEVIHVLTNDVVERKKGEWVSLNGWVTCSECGCEPPNETNIESDFCPNCGADMRKGESSGQ